MVNASSGEQQTGGGPVIWGLEAGAKNFPPYTKQLVTNCYARLVTLRVSLVCFSKIIRSSNRYGYTL
jgi:hypothetical protein